MKLYFDNGHSVRIIADVSDESDAFFKMNQFCAERSYKIPYIRKWKSTLNGISCWNFDVGSHTQFFYLIE